MPIAVVERSLTWERPTKGVVKINIDGAFCSKDMIAGVGVIGRDSNGRYLGSLGMIIDARSAFMSECRALLEALKMKDIFCDGEVIIETDCLELYRRVRSRNLDGCDWKCVEMMQECLELGDKTDRWSIALVARGDNSAADFLAAQAMRRMVRKDGLISHHLL
ncbi:uncharacterized protein LOC114721168 [Neltuma alba]|uniref:uncharacterized protein LOC114721168 n=1 Tax=Neltuma alba TaxID=207710 RepID=UPI0010A4690A|nr:uncharacterized protein LOC114721168 [Prosopis alba]